MSNDETTNPNATNTPNAATPAAPADDEMFTLSRSQLDAFRQRAIDEHKASAPAAPSAPETDPLARYYAGVSERRAKEQGKAPAAASGGSELAELIALQKLTLMSQLAASAPKAPEPIKPMSPDQKLAMRDTDTMLGRGPNGWTANDTAALRAQHEAELHRSGFTGDVASEARRRASKQLLEAFSGAAANIRIVPR